MCMHRRTHIHSTQRETREPERRKMKTKEKDSGQQECGGAGEGSRVNIIFMHRINRSSYSGGLHGELGDRKKEMEGQLCFD